MALGITDKLFVGNLDASRDWGYAKDYVEGMWRILQQETPEDYVLATGVTTPVRDFVRMAFKEVGIELEFSGKDDKEKAVVIACNHPFIIMGNKDSMRMMRKIGYRTFDNFIDQTYDSLPTHQRLQYITESIKKVDDIKNKLDWFKSMEEDIKFNQETLISKLFKFPDAYLNLKTYVNGNEIKKLI